MWLEPSWTTWLSDIFSCPYIYSTLLSSLNAGSKACTLVKIWLEIIISLFCLFVLHNKVTIHPNPHLGNIPVFYSGLPSYHMVSDSSFLYSSCSCDIQHLYVTMIQKTSLFLTNGTYMGPTTHIGYWDTSQVWKTIETQLSLAQDHTHSMNRNWPSKLYFLTLNYIVFCLATQSGPGRKVWPLFSKKCNGVYFVQVIILD